MFDVLIPFTRLLRIPLTDIPLDYIVFGGKSNFKNYCFAFIMLGFKFYLFWSLLKESCLWKFLSLLLLKIYTVYLFFTSGVTFSLLVYSFSGAFATFNKEFEELWVKLTAFWFECLFWKLLIGAIFSLLFDRLDFIIWIIRI